MKVTIARCWPDGTLTNIQDTTPNSRTLARLTERAEAAGCHVVEVDRIPTKSGDYEYDAENKCAREKPPFRKLVLRDRVRRSTERAALEAMLPNANDEDAGWINELIAELDEADGEV